MMSYLRLRQVCLVAPHLDSAAALISDILGLEECHRDTNVGKYGLENVLFPIGPDRFVEVVAPTREGTAAGRFLTRNGGRGGYMLIFDCDAPEPRARAAEAMGVRLANHIDRATFQGYQLHPRDCRACFLEFDHTSDGEALDGPYWPAGAGWQAHVKTDVTQALTGVVAATPDPASLSAHWGRIMQVAPAADGTIKVEAQTIAFAADPDAERLEALVIAAADPAGMLARARATGLETTANAFRLCGVWIRPEEASA